MATRTKWGFAGACLIALGLAWGCGGSLGSKSGGESHFLSYCDDTCPDGLSCIAGVCTRGCVVGEDECGDLHSDAECTDSIEPGEVATCDVTCTDDGSCESLGANYSCESGQCRGATQVSDGSNGSGGTTNGGGGGDGSCEVLFREYPNGATFDSPYDCGTCTCDSGELECESGDCSGPPAVTPCPPGVRTDPFELVGAFVQGDWLDLEVTHSGGCETHDFGVCYEGVLEPAPNNEPIEGELRLIHDSHGDSCESEVSATLHFNLLPYAEFIRENLGITGGMVDTKAFGFYAFGELDCEQTWLAATNMLIEQADATLGFGCSGEADCGWGQGMVSCGEANCWVGPIALLAVDRFNNSMSSLELGICGQAKEKGCPLEDPPESCGDPPLLACVDGQCVVSSE